MSNENFDFYAWVGGSLLFICVMITCCRCCRKNRRPVDHYDESSDMKNTPAFIGAMAASKRKCDDKLESLVFQQEGICSICMDDL